MEQGKEAVLSIVNSILQRLTEAKPRMGVSRIGSAVPGEIVPSIDLERIRERAIAQANAELPDEIRQLTPEECRARLREMGGVARALRLREPGDDDEEVAA